MRAPLALVLATAASAIAAPSCDRGHPSLSVRDTAPLRVVATTPKDGQLDVAVDAPIRVRFDRFLRPETAVRQSIRVTGGTIDATTGGAIAGEAFLEPTYDPVERVVTWRLPPGAQWQTGIRYSVTVWAARDHDGAGVLAWDGEQLEASVAVGFTPAAGVPAEPRMRVPAAYCSTCDANDKLVVGARDVLATCGSQSCHGPRDGSGGEMGLDLSSASAIARTALGRPAHGTFTGPSSTDAETNPFVFGVSMPIIDPGNPGNSYLLFKTMINPENYVREAKSNVPTSDPPIDGATAPTEVEVSRLTDGFVKGDPMPVGFGIGLDRLRVLQAWIAAGAPLQDGASCPDTSACDGSGPVHPVAEPVFARDVQPLLATSCDGGGCHSPPPDGTAPQRDIDFTGPASGYVGKKRKGDKDNEIIIVPGDVGKSFLINKLRNRLRDDPATPEVETYGLSCEQPPNRCGDPMPLVGAPLTDAQIKTLENWIAQGSKDP